MDMNELSYAQAYQQAQYGFPQNGFLTAEQVQQAMGLAGHVPTDASGQAILLDGSMNAQMAASDTAESEDSFDGSPPLFDEGAGMQAGGDGNVNSAEGSHGQQARGKDGDESVGNGVDTVKKRRRGRVRFTDRQVELLEARFVQDQYLPAMERTHLATVVGLNESQVKTWFQNRRAKSKRAAKRKARAAALASQPHGVMQMSSTQSSGCAPLRQCTAESSSSDAAQTQQQQPPYAGYTTSAYGAGGGQVYANGAAQTMSTSYTGTAPAVSPQQQYAMLGGVPANGTYHAHAQYAGGVNTAYQTPVAAAQAAYGAASMGYEGSSNMASSSAYSMYADQGLDYYARFLNPSAPAMMT